jgi:hypothetical protein
MTSFDIDPAVFGAINLDVAGFTANFIKFVTEGSFVHKVLETDLHVYIGMKPKVNGQQDSEADRDLTGLLKSGTKYFDAIYWLSIPATQRPEPNQTKTEIKDVLWSELADNLFIYWFFLFTQARPPGKGCPTPNFISSVKNVTRSMEEVANALASFNLIKINGQFIKGMKFPNLGQEASNRLALGCAGYRLISALSITPPDKAHPVGSEGERLFTKALEIRQILVNKRNCGADWNFHPLTKSQTLLGNTGSLNKNINDMMFFLYENQTLNLMHQQKLIFAVPSENRSYRAWFNWGSGTFNIPPDPITFK